MSTGDLLLGIDAGTSVVKAALFDGDGREIATTAQPTTLITPHPGWVEVDMAQTWSMTVRAVRELLRQTATPPERIAAIGVTGQMVGAWLVDADGQPIRPAILHNDGRAQTLVETLSEQQPGFMSDLFSYSGSVMQPGCTIPLIRWLQEHERHHLRQAQQVLCCKDWLVYRLTGTLQVDPTESSVMPGDTRRRTYAESLFDRFDIAAHRHLFPEVRPSDAIAGPLTAAAAAEIGLRAGTPVAVGAGDVPSSALGAGAVTPGTACTILGTVCMNGLVLDAPLFEPADVGLLFCMPGDLWLRMMLNLPGTPNLDWFASQFYAAESRQAASRAELFAQLEQAVERSRPGARGVIFHPYLAAVGVIAPFVEPGARAQFFGLTSDHTRDDMLRAVYEGVALAIRDCYQTLPLQVDEIRLIGGGARSALWSQIIADCAGKRVVVSVGTEFGAKGAALLAGVGIGWYEDIVSAAATTSTIARTHQPNPAHRTVYDETYALYAALRDDLRAAWQQGIRRRGAI